MSKTSEFLSLLILVIGVVMFLVSSPPPWALGMMLIIAGLFSIGVDLASGLVKAARGEETSAP